MAALFFSHSDPGNEHHFSSMRTVCLHQRFKEHVRTRRFRQVLKHGVPVRPLVVQEIVYNILQFYRTFPVPHSPTSFAVSFRRPTASSLA